METNCKDQDFLVCSVDYVHVVTTERQPAPQIINQNLGVFLIVPYEQGGWKGRALLVVMRHFICRAKGFGMK